MSDCDEGDRLGDMAYRGEEKKMLKKEVTTKVTFPGGAAEHSTFSPGIVQVHMGKESRSCSKRDLAEIIESLQAMAEMIA